ncbi:hypothetical protein Moror_17053 [Moniliophthora roreri MCA 2997]|uniref:Uncharacterized protein n=1 Tax=Moniliophthora roreri (strain MCA 2997) TaxID=1381753 RepID=V2WPT5_MONRO|nr:hypothetical protein Moror_17053 [Moniliophthora roreri MCA 2997]
MGGFSKHGPKTPNCKHRSRAKWNNLAASNFHLTLLQASLTRLCRVSGDEMRYRASTRYEGNTNLQDLSQSDFGIHRHGTYQDRGPPGNNYRCIRCSEQRTQWRRIQPIYTS